MSKDTNNVNKKKHFLWHLLSL